MKITSTSSQRPNYQKALPFTEPKETREERIERLLNTEPRIRPAAKFFTAEAFAEATAKAKQTLLQEQNS